MLQNKVQRVNISQAVKIMPIQWHWLHLQNICLDVFGVCLAVL